MSEVERIAKGLTRRQREAVCAQATFGHLARYALAEAALCDRNDWQQAYETPEPPRYSLSLTPLGLAVRNHLLAEERGDG